MEQVFYIVATVWMIGYTFIALFKRIRKTQKKRARRIHQLQYVLGKESHPSHPEYRKFLEKIQRFETKYDAPSRIRKLWQELYRKPFPLPYPVTALPDQRPIPSATSDS
jgi:hypothetical protein